MFAKDQNSYWDEKSILDVSVFCRLIGKNKKTIIGAFKGRKNDKMLVEIIEQQQQQQQQKKNAGKFV